MGQGNLFRAYESRLAARDVHADTLRLARHAEVSVKLSAVGQALPEVGTELATTNAHRICAAAHQLGTTVTLDMEDHTTTDRTLATLRELRRDYPETGATLYGTTPTFLERLGLGSLDELPPLAPYLPSGAYL